LTQRGKNQDSGELDLGGWKNPYFRWGMSKKKEKVLEERKGEKAN